MPSAFAIIGTAWRFYRKQPVLNAVAFWLFFAPNAALHVLDSVSKYMFPETPSDMMSPVALAVSIPLIVAMVYLAFWGQACVIIVGKRTINSPAGRNRSSFSAVREQARPYIFPLFATEVIRSCTGLLWSLLLIVPGVIYFVRTLFYDILIIGEGTQYGREALKRSQALVQGRTGEIFWKTLLMAVTTVLPLVLLGEGISMAFLQLDERLATLGILISDAIGAYVSMFFVLCVITLFAELKKAVAPIGASLPQS